MSQKIVAIVPRIFTLNVPDNSSQLQIIDSVLAQLDDESLGVGERVVGELPESIQMASMEGVAEEDKYIWFDADSNPHNGVGLPPGYDALHAFVTKVANLGYDKNPRALLIELQSWAQDLVGKTPPEFSDS